MAGSWETLVSTTPIERMVLSLEYYTQDTAFLTSPATRLIQFLAWLNAGHGTERFVAFALIYSLSRLTSRAYGDKNMINFNGLRFFVSVFRHG